MRVYTLFFLIIISITAGIVFLPFTSHSFSLKDIRTLRENNAKKREIRQEQFRQDIIKKRKDMLRKWAGRKSDIKEKLTKEKDYITSEFSMFRQQRVKKARYSAATGMQKKEGMDTNFFTTIQKNVMSIMRLFLPR